MREDHARSIDVSTRGAVARGAARCAALVATLLAFVLAPATAFCAAPTDNDTPQPNRDELIPVPHIGGNSDIGAELGLGLSLARFREGHRPYLFRLDAVAEASFKIDHGFRVLQQYYSLRLDTPQFLSPRVRLDTRIDFVHRINAAWFGPGNASLAIPRAAPPDATSAYEYISQRARLRSQLRIKTDTPFDLAFASNTRYEFPDPYGGSKLEEDLASGTIIGGKPALLQTIAAGFMVDTRDNEFRPQRGIFYQVGVSGTVGSEESVRFGEASAVLAHYAPLGGPFTFASRMVGSFEFGNMPYYELAQGGVFAPQYLVGGSRGIRGVRLGRYVGRIKIVTNTELRVAPFPRFGVLGWKVLVGMTAFFDAGRVWADYKFDPQVDGTKLGLKWGAGGGFFFQWDQANVFRIEIAHSGEAGGFPIAYYLENGLIF
jgi:outer membrane protein assembly factor BamA